jgi:hypothetical protein
LNESHRGFRYESTMATILFHFEGECDDKVRFVFHFGKHRCNDGPC